MRNLLAKIVAITLVTAPIGAQLCAHLDGVGDLHPDVQAKNGLFFIRYYHKKDPNEDSETSLFYQSIFTKTGALVAPRHRLMSRPQIFQPAFHGSTWPRQVGDLSYRVPSSADRIELTQQDSPTVHRRLYWPEGRCPFNIFEDAKIIGRQLFLLGTTQDFSDRTPVSSLILAIFDLQKASPPKIHNLGVVTTIYDFPACSAIVECQGYVYVAWMNQTEQTLKLSFVDLANLQLSTNPLKAKFTGNTKISMAAIDNQLCLAWHLGLQDGDFNPAKIETLFIPAPIPTE